MKRNGSAQVTVSKAITPVGYS